MEKNLNKLPLKPNKKVMIGLPTVSQRKFPSYKLLLLRHTLLSMESTKAKIPFLSLNRKNLRMKKSASQLKIISYNGVSLVDGMVVSLIL